MAVLEVYCTVTFLKHYFSLKGNNRNQVISIFIPFNTRKRWEGEEPARKESTTVSFIQKVEALQSS